MVHTGWVSSFDDHRGLGEVRSDNGDTFPFHCVEIANGTRTIEVGAAVTFALAPRLGRDEAVAVTVR